MEWERSRIAAWISEHRKPLVVGWPFNGTRRWYLVHQRENRDTDDYVTTILRVQAERQRILFSLGASAILSPCFGYELLNRGEEYTHAVLSALLKLEDEPTHRKMFEDGIRLRFYGEYEKELDTPRLRPMLQACDNLMQRTAHKKGPLLLLGLFADSPHEWLARTSVEFAAKHGRPPDRGELVREYYGVDVPDLSLYIGFAQPALFDVPLITTGNEDLYATLSPSPEVTERQLREILYDHLLLRRLEDADYDYFSEEAVERLKEYSKVQREQTLGVGRIDSLTGMWNPLPSSLAAHAYNGS